MNISVIGIRSLHPYTLATDKLIYTDEASYTYTGQNEVIESQSKHAIQ